MSGSLIFFVTSAVFFALSMLMFVFSFLHGRRKRKANAEKFVVLKSEMLIHTEERIAYHSQTRKVETR